MQDVPYVISNDAVNLHGNGAVLITSVAILRFFIWMALILTISLLVYNLLGFRMQMGNLIMFNGPQIGVRSHLYSTYKT